MTDLKVNALSIDSRATSFESKDIQSNQIPKNFESAFKDCTDLYTVQEIKDIIKRAGTENTFTNQSKFEVMYIPKKNALIINNKSLTNDTLEIYSNGSAKHVGSWHNKKVAEAGTFNDVIEDAQKRYEASNS